MRYWFPGICILGFALAEAGFGGTIEFNVPDFYQHQRSPTPAVNQEDDTKIDFSKAAAKPASAPSFDLNGPTWWEDGGGWCCMSALVDNFYYLEKAFGWQGFFTRGDRSDPAKKFDNTLGDWQQQMVYDTEDAALNIIFGPKVTRGQYVRSIGSAFPFLYSEFVADNPFNAAKGRTQSFSGGAILESDDDGTGKLGAPVAVPQYASLFEVVQTAICRGDAVDILIDYPVDGRPIPTNNPWWDGSFHTMAVRGVSSCTDKTALSFTVADPDKTHKISDTDATKYIADRVRLPYSTSNTLPIPTQDANFESVTVDANGVITAYTGNAYNGAGIFDVIVIHPTPEPDTLTMLMVGLAAVGVVVRRRGLNLWRN